MQRCAKAAHRPSPLPSFDPPLHPRLPNGGTRARKCARPAMMHRRRARVLELGNQGNAPADSPCSSSPHSFSTIFLLFQTSDTRFATVTPKANTSSSLPHSKSPPTPHPPPPSHALRFEPEVAQDSDEERVLRKKALQVSSRDWASPASRVKYFVSFLWLRAPQPPPTPPPP